MLPEKVQLSLSDQRFRVIYRLLGTEADAKAKSEAICVEQTVEFPRELLPKGDIDQQIVGWVEEFTQIDDRHFDAGISYPIEVVGGELGQFVNVLFGNVSILPGVRVKSLELPPALLSRFRGPRYGRPGLRELLGVPDRPLLCTALKPMGLSGEELAKLAYEFAHSGVDIIKDDHGLANQPFCAWEDRVRLCAEAVARANDKTGKRAIYMPSLMGTSLPLQERALRAKELGAGGLLVAPGIVGFDALAGLAASDALALPIMSHPSFLGSYVIHPDHGIDHRVLFGELMRMAGVDASVYPNYGGRFSFTKEECLDIVAGTECSMERMRSMFPTPGGGMILDRVPEMVQAYGKDVVLLIGGGLFKGGSIAENMRRFLEMLPK